MKKQSVLIGLLTGYFYLLGLGLIGHGVYPRIDAQIKEDLYHQVEVRFDELKQILERNTFRDRDSLGFYEEHRADLIEIMRQFRRNYLDRTSGWVTGVVIAALLSGVLFIGAGTLFIRRSPAARKGLILAYSAYTVYLVLYIVNAYFEIQFLDRTSVELWQLSSLFEPDMGDLRYTPLVKSLSDFAVTRVALFAVVSAMACLIVPLYGLTRPACWEYWRHPKDDRSR